MWGHTVSGWQHTLRGCEINSWATGQGAAFFLSHTFASFVAATSKNDLTLAGIGGVQPPSGFPRIIRERIGRSSRNLLHLTIEQFYTFPENFKSVPTMTFDLWPDFQGHVKRNLRSVPFQRLKLTNFGMFAGDMDMGRCWEVTSMVYTDIVPFPRSTEVIRGQWPLMTSHAIFRVFVPPGVLWCADFWNWHPFAIHIHLFPPNLGGSARILDKVHPISAVRHISQLNLSSASNSS